jgi:hypothetical protein
MAFTPLPPHFLLEYLCLSAFRNEGVGEQPPHHPLITPSQRSLVEAICHITESH